MPAPTEPPKALAKTPLHLTGALQDFPSIEVTPCIGTEFPDISLSAILSLPPPKRDPILRDLAVLASERGVLFFRRQASLTNELQKELTDLLGKLSGRPEENGVHVHPMHVIRGDEMHISRLDPVVQQQTHLGGKKEGRQTSADEWHSDMTFEANPPDFSVLRMTEVPRTGGDTMWASTYELYDRLSPPYQKFFESLTGFHDSPGLRRVAGDKEDVYTGERGSPYNTGLHFSHNHPMVRTHPVTGWKALFAGGLHQRGINDVTPRESEELLEKIRRLVSDNHDLQVRLRWNNAGDMAIWDNRCTLHIPTQDHYSEGGRMGYRCISIAEKPYLDPHSFSRKQSRLAQEAKKNGDIAANGANGCT